MDDLHKMNDESPVEQSAPQCVPYTIDRAIAEALAALDETDATIEAGQETANRRSSDPSADEADIEYWIWTGHRLVQASPKATERLRQQEELEREELRFLQGRQRIYRLRRRQAYRHFLLVLVLPLRRLAATIHSWKRNLRGLEKRETVGEASSNDKIDKIS